MKCQVCGKMGQEEDDVCPFCGATVRSVFGKGMPLPTETVQELEARERERESGEAERRKRRTYDDALAGAIVFFAAGMVVLVARVFSSIGYFIGGSPHGDSFLSFLVGFVLAVVYAVVLGAPMGLLIGRTGLGLVASGLVGMMLFVVGYYPLLRFLFGPIHPIMQVAMVPAMGFVTGMLISFHVQARGT